jgi:hypothetical protein
VVPVRSSNSTDRCVCHRSYIKETVQWHQDVGYCMYHHTHTIMRTLVVTESVRLYENV